MATLSKSLAECTANAGLETHTTSPTFRLYGNFTSDVTPRLRLVGCSPWVRGASPARRGAYPPGMSKAASDVANQTVSRLPVDVASPAGGGPSPAGGGPSPAGGLPSPAGDVQSQAGDFHRHAQLDHVYTKGFISESKVMPDATADHRPVVTTVRAGGHCPGTKLVSLKRRNFKAITRVELEGALAGTDWTRVYAIRDVDDIREYITAGIVLALNIVWDRFPTWSTAAWPRVRFQPNSRLAGCTPFTKGKGSRGRTRGPTGPSPSCRR
jgi:hypothetical protein